MEIFGQLVERELIHVALEFDDRFERSFGVTPLLPKGIETECAELAFERTSPRCQECVERVAAESNTVFNKAISVLS